MDMKDAIKQLNDIDNKLHAINHAQAIIYWDAATGAPKNSVEGRANTLSILTGEYYQTLVNETFDNLLNKLAEHKDALDFVTLRKVEEFRNEYDKIAKIPVDMYKAYTADQAKASVAWEEAKEKSDFSIFAPHLEKLVDYNKKFIEYRGFQKHPYNTLLGDYEKNLTTDELDEFFSELKHTIVPLVAKINASDVKVNNDFTKLSYSVDKQEALNKDLLKAIGFDMDSGIMAKSVHPFTTNFNRHDVRVTTRYFEHNPFSAIYSTIHEGGHGIYEQNIGEALDFSTLGTGTSMGIHESQSRFFENIIGRSYPFMVYFFPIFKEAFPENLKDLSLYDFYLAVNKSEQSLIRIEADELTYSLHIMIRYEIEKLLIENKVLVKDLPALWNKKYEEYMGLVPENDAEGVLQDVHWSEGLFGYFPSYALGSAYASQFAHAMRKAFDLSEDLKKGDFSRIKDWLRTHIHQHGRLLSPSEIIEKTTGEPFNPKYYTEYLKEKFSEIYKLKD